MYRLINHDVSKFLPALVESKVQVDCVVTSPPYNLGASYPGIDDNLPDDKYLRWCLGWLEQLSKLLKKDGSLFLNLGGKVSNSMLPLRVIRQTYRWFDLQNTIVWVKSIAIPDADTSFGHFKPVNSNAYLSGMFEYIFHLVPRGSKVKLHKQRIGVPYTDKSNVNRYGKGRDKRDVGNTWFIPYETRNASKMHPATFPIELPLRCLRLALHGKDSVVLDPFVGAGSTGVACARLGVANFIGVDKAKSYIQMATTAIGSELLERKRRESLSASYQKGGDCT